MKFTAAQAGARSARSYDVSPAVFDRNYTYLEEQMFDPSVRTKLLNPPLKVAHELRAVKTPTVRPALRIHMAPPIDTLLHVPLRIRHPSELDLEPTIFPPISGQHPIPATPSDRAQMSHAYPRTDAHQH